MLHAFTVNSGWSTVVLRPTNVYGPGQLPIKGFAIVPTIFRHLRDRSVFEIWGDGSVVRDYLFVDDLCALITRAIVDEARAYSVYNAGSGTAVSILELVRLCEQTVGMKLGTTLRPGRAVDVARAIPNIGAITKAFDWRAPTSLAAGLAQTWQWLRTTFPSP